MMRWPIIVLLAVAGFAAGVFVEREWLSISDPDLLPWSPPRPRPKQRVWSQVEAKPHGDSVACPETATIVVVAGQSNAANTVGQRSRAAENVFWRFEGRCYPAIDPMPGSEGGFGSVWPRVGDELIRSGVSRAVVFVGAAMGGTSISQWADASGLGSYLHERLVNEPRIDFVLWHQGEADALAGTASTTYKNDLLAVVATIRERLKTTPIYISIASRCGRVKPDPEIRRAQSEVIQVEAGILAGPDTDTLDHCYRYDGCHFSELGLERVSGLWDVRLSAPANR